jgi:hypothetical protein
VDALLDNPLALGAAAAVVLLGLAALRRRGAAGKAEEIPGLDALIAAGKYDDAAPLALEHQRPRVAIELLLRGQRAPRASPRARATCASPGSSTTARRISSAPRNATSAPG